MYVYVYVYKCADACILALKLDEKKNTFMAIFLQNHPNCCRIFNEENIAHAINDEQIHILNAKEIIKLKLVHIINNVVSNSFGVCNALYFAQFGVYIAT